MQYKIKITYKYLIFELQQFQESEVELNSNDFEWDGLIEMSKRKRKPAKRKIKGLKLWGENYVKLLSQKSSYCVNNKISITTEYGQVVFAGEFSPKECDFEKDSCVATLGVISHKQTSDCETKVDDYNYYQDLIPKLVQVKTLGERQDIECINYADTAICLGDYTQNEVAPIPANIEVPLNCGQSSEYFMTSHNYRITQRDCCTAAYDEFGGGCYEWQSIDSWWQRTLYARVVATTDSNSTPPDTVHTWVLIEQISNGRWLWKRKAFTETQFPDFIPNGVKLFDLLSVIFGCEVVSHLFSLGAPSDNIPTVLPSELEMYEASIRNEYANMILHQIGDVIDPHASNLSELFRISKDEIMDDLETMFNVEFRQVGNKWQVEHVNWWANTATGCVKIIEESDKISFKKESNIIRERWKWPTESSEKWKSNNLFDYICGNETKEHPVKVISTDAAWIYNSGTVEKDEGYVLIACTPTDVNGNNYVIKDNTPLNFDSLLNRFHRWGRPSNIIKNADGSYSKIGVEKIEKVQAEGDVCCGIFDINQQVKGMIVENAIWDLNTNKVKLKLLK